MGLSRAAFAERFGARPLFGMVHLAPLPGAPLFAGSLRSVIDAARADAGALLEGGAAAIVFENFGDRPFFKSVTSETVAAMTRVISDVTRGLDLPFGVNVLRNDGRAALAIAAATGAAFIRVNVLTGAMLTDQGVIEGEAANLLRLRAILAPSVAIFADHMVKHATPLAPLDPMQQAKDLRERGLADAIIVTGRETGGEADLEMLRRLRELVDAPLLVGSGLGETNAARFAPLCDGAIAGTSLKHEARVDQPVEAERVRRLAAALRTAEPPPDAR